MRFCILVSIAFAASATPVHANDAAAPRILGFERSRPAEMDEVATGNLLLGELNCTSCHAADPALESAVQRKPAPVLDTVGSRVQPHYLLKFLADPHSAKPGTTMPNGRGRLP
jgi:hypothetical protein